MAAMKRMLLTLVATLSFVISVKAEKTLDIYWVDVEGGAATLMVTPAGQAILIDTGNPGTRDADRIHEVATKQAGLKKIDFIGEIPPCYKNTQDVFITDPPYTVEGLTRFISVGAEMLKERTNGLGFVSYSNLIPVENARLFRNIASMGLSPQEIIPVFNEYVGAQKHAGVSRMGKFFSSGYLKPVNPTSRNFIYTNSKET